MPAGHQAASDQPVAAAPVEPLAPLVEEPATPADAGTEAPPEPVGGFETTILHGAEDPLVPQSDIDTFMAEMRAAKADWQLIAYGNAVHSFTNPDWPPDETCTKATAYHEKTDKRSWIAMADFLREVFA